VSFNIARPPRELFYYKDTNTCIGASSDMDEAEIEEFKEAQARGENRS
jgi:hypothetical protein